MDEREFNALADAMLGRIEDAIEASGVDVDLEVKTGGVLEVTFADGSKLIINRHGAARDIWLAARSGGYHFRPEGGRWLSARDGEELLAVLGRCVSAQAGVVVAFR